MKTYAILWRRDDVWCVWHSGLDILKYSREESIIQTYRRERERDTRNRWEVSGEGRERGCLSLQLPWHTDKYRLSKTGRQSGTAEWFTVHSFQRSHRKLCDTNLVWTHFCNMIYFYPKYMTITGTSAVSTETALWNHDSDDAGGLRGWFIKHVM